MIWFFLHMGAAFLWICWAVGFMQYEPWLVPAAFICLALGCIFNAIQSLLKAVAANGTR
jgi:hypothetical protein